MNEVFRQMDDDTLEDDTLDDDTLDDDTLSDRPDGVSWRKDY